MRRWERAPWAKWCGGCDAVIAKSDPLFLLVTDTWTKIRCVACAAKLGERVPATIPELEPPRGVREPRGVPTGIERRPPPANMAELAAKFKSSMPWRSATYSQRVAQIQTIKQVLKDMKLSAAGKD